MKVLRLGFRHALRDAFGRARCAVIGGVALACASGCVESGVYEKTASQLEEASRAAQQKDQQIRALEWQVVTLAQQLREAQLRGEAGQRDLAAQVQQLAAANATLTERLRAKEEDAARTPLPVPDDGASGRPGDRRKTDDVRALVLALDAQNARLMERLTRLEQKLDTRAAEDARGRPHPARPERTVDTDIVDPWGFGARK